MSISQFKLLIFFIAIFIAGYGHGQECTGSLGENIFSDGDFGSGTDVILQTDPDIAPGYTYERNPPPEDGLYTITSNTGGWGFNYETWLNITDNSSDPNGYMMVVNASVQPGLFYDQEVTGLCENTLYQFSSDVINLIRIGVSDHILPNVSFLIDGLEAYSTGQVPQDEAWHAYGFTFTTGPGQTSVLLSLRNNAPGGIGNDLALDNISFRPCGPGTFILPLEVENICEDGAPILLEGTIEGDQYDSPQIQWQESLDNGLTWSDLNGATNLTYMHTNVATGLYYYRFILANSTGNLANSRCRAISNIKIVQVIPKFYIIIDSICEGNDLLFNDNLINASGTYVDSLTSSIGCDSIVILDLTVVPDNDNQTTWEIVDPSCSNDSDGSIQIFPDVLLVNPYELFINDEPILPNFLLENLPAGSYELLIRDRFGCTFNETISITNPEPFLINIGADTTIQVGSTFSFELQANDEISSTSVYPEELICPSPCNFLEWTPLSNTQVILGATSTQNCIASDTLNITVVQDRTIHFPNVFSPNNDGINDYFTGFGLTPNIQNIERLHIYDRWGNLVHTENQLAINESSGWDGNTNNQPVAAGVYVYVAEVLFLDGNVLTFSGDITVVR